MLCVYVAHRCQGINASTIAFSEYCVFLVNGSTRGWFLEPLELAVGVGKEGSLTGKLSLTLSHLLTPGNFDTTQPPKLPAHCHPQPSNLERLGSPKELVPR